MEDLTLLKKAIDVRNKAYVPYSEFKVGAAILTKEGKVFTGCNVENVSFGATICAEQVAITKAISEGYKEFEKIAVIGDLNKATFPCGICRQVIMEFSKDIKLIIGKGLEEYDVYQIRDILPKAFEEF